MKTDTSFSFSLILYFILFLSSSGQSQNSITILNNSKGLGNIVHNGSLYIQADNANAEQLEIKRLDISYATIMNYNFMDIQLTDIRTKASYDLPLDQVQSLEMLYNTTGGSSWKWSIPYALYGIPWNFSQPTPNPCSEGWQGITCSSDCKLSPCDVTELALPSYGLNGSLPSSLGNLIGVTVLDFYDNKLTGTIPSTIAELQHLTQIYLDFNKLTGPIPSSLGLLLSLEYLYIDHNRLTGSIPSELGHITALQYLYLDNNFLRSTIPASLGNLSQLQYLYLHNNILSGSIPAEIGSLGNLLYLSLYTNKLTRSIPNEISSLTSLQYIYLHENSLTGSIPSSLGDLVQLIGIYLYDNLLSGSIPRTLSSLTKAKDLSLYSNMLTANIPAELASLESLEGLYLDYNLLTSAIPSELSKLNNLIDLSVSDNLLTGSIPAELSSLTNLGQLYLSFNHLSGSIPSTIGELTKLENAAFSSNHLNGTIPSDFGLLADLDYLYLENNYLSGCIPVEFGFLTSLTYLYMDNNLISCSLPAQLSSMHSLYYFSADYNHINGSIPAEFGDFKSLSIFHASFNYLVGSIPKQISNLRTLQYIVLSHNNLTGSIPSGLFALDSIVEITLSNNYLSGNLSLLSQVRSKNLTVLSLNNNKFTGTLPARLHYPSLIQLELQANNLIGKFPSLHGPQLVYLNAGDNKFSGALPLLNLSTALQFVNFSSNRFTGHLQSIGSSSLESFDISNNQISGTIGDYFQQIGSLTTLSLASNKLTGNIYSLFNSSMQTLVEYIDMSNNRISGSLPSFLFLSPSLKTIVMTGNCLTGSLPGTVCSATNLTTLVLDGMGANIECNLKLFPHTSSKSYISNSQSEPSKINKLPTCLFSDLPLLQTLHLSGLGLHSSLPAASTTTGLPTTLRYLSLSYNQLTGTIPDAYFQHQGWLELDLSFNYISGTLPKASDASSYNLSATAAQLNLQINYLSGEIPSPLLALTSVDILSGNLFGCRASAGSASDLPKHDPDASSYQCGSSDVDVILFVWLGTICFIGLLLIAFHYGVFKVNISLQSVFRPFSSSPNTKKGARLFLQLLSLCLYFTCGILTFSVIILVPEYASMSHLYPTYTEQYAWTISACYKKGQVPAIALLLTLFILLGVSLKLITLNKKIRVDVDDARSQYQVENKNTLVDRICFTSIALCGGFLIVAMNGAYVFAVEQRLKTEYLFLVIVSLAAFKLLSTALVIRSPLISSQAAVYMLCVSNVLVPLLVESFVSFDCFYFATLASSPEVSSTITVEECTIQLIPSQFYSSAVLYSAGLDYVKACYPTQQGISYQPPFIYSYACGSSLVTDFASVFALRYLWSGLLYPAIQVVVDKLLRYMSSRHLDHLGLFSILEALQYNRWRIIRMIQFGSEDAILQDTESPAEFFNYRQFSVSLVSDVAVLLSFGVLFPPLAVLVSVSILVHIIDYRLAVEEIIKLSRQTEPWEGWLSMLEVELMRSFDVLHRPMPWVAYLVALIWSLLLFDTLGASVGAEAACWIVIVMILSPLWWTGVYYIEKRNYLLSREDLKQKGASSDSSSQDGTSGTLYRGESFFSYFNSLQFRRTNDASIVNPLVEKKSIIELI